MGKKTIFGFSILFAVVVGNGILTTRLGGLTYSRFTWEAYAQVYGPTPTPTASPSPSPSPTATPVGLGDPCTSLSDCSTGLFCADGVCCDAACQGEGQRCNVPSNLGHCETRPVAVPITLPYAAILALVLMAVGAVSVGRIWGRSDRS